LFGRFPKNKPTLHSSLFLFLRVYLSPPHSSHLPSCTSPPIPCHSSLVTQSLDYYPFPCMTLFSVDFDICSPLSHESLRGDRHQHQHRHWKLLSPFVGDIHFSHDTEK
jgi:hypothetical protein